MSLLSILLIGFAAVMTIMMLLWIERIFIKNVSIVDIFWGYGFVVVTSIYYILTENGGDRNLVLFVLVFVLGMLLSIYLARRNIGKPEDFRYQEFRRKYGEHR